MNGIRLLFLSRCPKGLSGHSICRRLPNKTGRSFLPQKGFFMETLSSLLMLAAAVVLLVLLVKVLAAPIRLIFKLAVNAALGFLILFVVNFFGDFVGIGVTVNLFTALIAGVLGVPGVVLLVLLQFLF